MFNWLIDAYNLNICLFIFSEYFSRYHLPTVFKSEVNLMPFDQLFESNGLFSKLIHGILS